MHDAESHSSNADSRSYLEGRGVKSESNTQWVSKAGSDGASDAEGRKKGVDEAGTRTSSTAGVSASGFCGWSLCEEYGRLGCKWAKDALKQQMRGCDASACSCGHTSVLRVIYDSMRSTRAARMACSADGCSDMDGLMPSM